MRETVDERVVEMRFDNKNFEDNVKTSMTTLGKLKNALNMDEAAKGLAKLQKEANDIDLSRLNSSIDEVRLRFSALDFIKVKVFDRIADDILDAGKRIVNAFTFEPINTGFDEFELKMGSVQTIMASTGASLETVNKYLAELNTYSDKTIYSFADMTNNIGKFTNAGVKLEDAVAAIKGVSNEAAVSGANAAEASRAMYNFAQALSAGYVKLIDWKSIENANMATVEFKQQLLDTALELGTVVKKGDQYITTTKNAKGKVSDLFDATHNFNDALNNQWMTTDVLTKTLAKYADEETEIGKKAYAAAQDVKTFHMMMDTLKEAAQSGWAQTWELIVGDFEQGKELWTGLANFFGSLIDNVSNARNRMLEVIMSNPITQLSKKLKNLSSDAKKAIDKVNDLGKVVDQVIGGKFGNGQKRFDELTKRGYDWAKVQNIVNERLGSSVRHTEKVAEANKKLAKTHKDIVGPLDNLSKKQLKNLGLTKDEIYLYGELRKESERTGKSITDLIDDMGKRQTGRELIIDSFKNIKDGITPILKVIGKAWREVFPEKNLIQKANSIYDIFKGLNDATKNFSETTEHMKKQLKDQDSILSKIKRTFKGVFAALDLVRMVVGGPITIGFRIFKSILEAFNIDILSVTANVGDAVVAFRDWVKENDFLKKGIEKALPYFEKMFDNIKKVLPRLKQSFKNVTGWTANIFKKTRDISKNVIDGLVNGIRDRIGDVWNIGINIAKNLLDSVRQFLGIHSPARKFIEIAKYIIEGLIEGFKTYGPKVWSNLKEFLKNGIEGLKSLKYGKIIGAALGFGFLIAVFKFIKTLQKFYGPLDGLKGLFNSVGGVIVRVGGVLDTLKNVLENVGKSAKNYLNSKAVENIAISILMLAGAIFILSKIDSGKMWECVGAIAAISAVVVGLTYAVSKMGSVEGVSPKQILSLAAVSAALFIIAVTLKKLASIDPKDIPKTIGLFSLIMISFLAFIKVVGKSGKHADKAGFMILKISVAMSIIVRVIKTLAKMSNRDIDKGIRAIAKIELLFAGIILVSKMAGKYGSSAGSLILKMSFAILLMVGILSLLSLMKPENIDKGLRAIAKMELLFAGIILVSKMAGKHGSVAGTLLLKMSFALLIMVGIIGILAIMDPSDVDKGVSVMTRFMLLFSGLILVTKIAGKNGTKVGTSLLMMSGAILVLTGVIYLLSTMDSDAVKKSLDIITSMMLMFGGLIAVSRLSGNNINTIVALSIAVVVLSGALALLSLVDTNKLEGAAKSMAVMIASFGVLVAATGKMKSINKKSIISLYALIGVVAVLAIILGVMSKLKVEGSIQTATAIGILLNSMASSMYILKRAKKVSMDSVLALYAISGVVAILAGILGVMSGLHVEGSIKTAIALGVLLNAMAAAMFILKFVGPDAILGVAAMAPLTMIVAGLAVILGLMDHFDVEPSMKTVMALSTLLLAMSASLVVLGIVGAMGPAAFIGIGALAVLVTGMGALLVGLGALTKKFPEVETFLDKGLPILEKIGKGLGKFFGGIAEGFISSVLDIIPDIGTKLSKFMENIQPFLDGASEIDPSVMNGVKSLAEAILILTAAEFIDGLKSLLGFGDNGLDKFGEKLVPFGKSLSDFSDVVKGVDGPAVESVASAGKMLADMADKVPNSGGKIAEWLGDNNIDEFGARLRVFGTHIVAFSETVSGKIDSEAVEAAANAGSMLADMADKVPNSGGIIAEWLGDNNIDEFGSRLVVFGSHIVSFSKAISGKVDVKSVEAAANAGTLMAELADKIPNSGGKIAEWFGDNTIDDFGNRLVVFGNKIVEFSNIVTGQNGGTVINARAISAASSAGMVMAALANNLPKGDSIWDVFTGHDTLDDFGEKLASFGSAIKDFSTEVSDVKIGSADSAATIGTTMVDMANKITDDTGSLNDLGNDIVSFGEKIQEFDSKVSDINGNELVNNVRSFRTAVDTLKSIGKSGVDAFINSFSDAESNAISAATEMVDGSITALNNKTESFVKCGTDLASKFSKALSDNKNIMAKEFETISYVAINIIKGMFADFKECGEYLVKGFVSGIKDNTFEAEKASKEMAKASAKAATKELDINSPSKVFYGIGNFAGLGFVKALGDYENKSYDAGSGIAESARDGLSNAISKVRNLINNGMDDELTIRPILDLSDVENSAGALNGLLDTTANVGLMTNIGSISSMMHGSRQNGKNSDVISAIRDLKRTISNSSGDTYNVGGITYDDGSNVADAVKSLVRAARVERRI